MADFPPQTVSLACPRCGAPIQTVVHNLIDVGLEPELKDRLLRGRINVARCNNCGSEGVIAAPIVYHDPDKELLLAFIPSEMGLQDEERQRIIGEMTNLIMAYLPPEKRKGYLLVPKELLSYQSLLEMILQAEGITPDMMAEQRARMDLIERLSSAMAEEDRLASLVAEVDEQLDFEFFATLGAFIEANRQDGLDDRYQQLEGLREQLLELSSYGRKVVTQMLEDTAEQTPLSREELMDTLLEADSEEEIVDLVTWYRSAVDYQFFQMLTARLESAEQEGREEEAQHLGDLRETLLKVTEEIDAQTRRALEHAAGLLRQLLEAPDSEAFVREHLNEFNDAFFIVLGANLQAAEESGQEEVRQRLQEMGSLVLHIAQERLPPEVRLIQQLLQVPDDEAAVTLLEENPFIVGERLIGLMHELAQDVQNEQTSARLEHLAGLTQQWLREQEEEFVDL